MTPEAYRGGGLLYLQTGDLLYLGLRERQIRFLNPQLLREGGDVVTSGFRDIPTTRKILGQKRMARMRERRRRITSCNRLSGHTDAAHGVVPLEVYEEAVLDYRDQAARMADNELKGVTKH
jgi:dihydroxyacid dehydratase/phosphogluconate dehydratase